MTSSAQFQREADAARIGLADTLGQLRDGMAPSALSSEAIALVKDSGLFILKTFNAFDKRFKLSRRNATDITHKILLDHKWFSFYRSTLWHLARQRMSSPSDCSDHLHAEYQQNHLAA